jgi:hypothetical protein
MDTMEKTKTYLRKNKQTLEHISNFFFRSFEWQDMIKEGWPIRCVNVRRRCSYDGLGVHYARMWTFNDLATTPNENGKTPLN